jgi:predicted anti-sigma-YlaC factor YlaD
VDQENNPVVSFARAAQTAAETQQILAQTHLRIAETQRRLDESYGFGVRVQTFALTMIGVAVLGLGVLLWLGLSHSAEHAAQTQALLELLRRANESVRGAP